MSKAEGTALLKMNTTRNRIMLQMLGTFSSAIAGPMAGVFLMGMFIPWTNTKVNRYKKNIVLAGELLGIVRIDQIHHNNRLISIHFSFFWHHSGQLILLFVFHYLRVPV